MRESSGERAAAFDVAGPPGAPAIVFVHGAAWTRCMWAPQMAALAADFRVVALDLPGHGARKGEPFRLATAVEALDQVLHEAGLDRALLVGLSLGGYVAIAYAAGHAAQAAGLVLSGSCVDYQGLVGMLSQLDAAVVLRLIGARRVAQIQARSVLKAFPAAIAEQQVGAGFSFDVMPAVYRELRTTDFRAPLALYAGPALLLNGERDRANRKGERRMLDATRDGRVAIVPGAGHLCNLDQPEAFTAAIRDFAAVMQRTEIQ